MKWGVRRFQKKDGSLTNAGKKRYSDDSNAKRNPIQKHKDNLAQKYMDRGYSKEHAKILANRRFKTEMVVGAVGTVAVAVIAKKAATAIGREYMDQVIKSGKTVQNVAPSGDITYQDRPFYAAVNKHDKKAYGAMYPLEKRGMVLVSEAAGKGQNTMVFIKTKCN